MLLRKRQPGGWTLIEILVSMSVLSLLMGVWVVARGRFADFNSFHLKKQQCIAAAQAQLDSVAATGREITEKELRRLWPGVRVELSRSPGTGDWTGLTLVTAAARANSRGRAVTAVLSRYLPAEGGP